jgi:hypothetical protein
MANPFPPSYYLTCPRLASAVGRLEGSGLMRQLQDRLATEPRLADGYRQAHQAYLGERERLGVVPEIEGISAAGCPTGSSACTYWLRTPRGADPGSTRSAMRSWPALNPGGTRVLRRPESAARPGDGTVTGDRVNGDRVAAIDRGTNAIDSWWQAWTAPAC